MKKVIKSKTFKYILNILLSALLSCILEKFYFKQPLELDRLIIVFLLFLFIGIHFIIKVKDIYDFMYRKRYLIAAILLIIIVMLGYNGTSLNYWDKYIQPSYSKLEYQPILGKARAIRSDEWVVGTTVDLSQSKLKKPFSSTNNISRGTDTEVALITKSPIKSINMLINPFKIGFILFGNKAGVSFWWYGRLFALFLITFELIMIITNKKKKISLFGTILITLAPVVQWWFSTPLVDILIYGELAVIILNAFFNSNKRRDKILLSILLGIIGSAYICCYYPAWEISFGYVFLILFIWLIVKNKNKINFRIIWYILLCILTMGLLVTYMLYSSREALFIILNTAYPGKRTTLGGEGWKLLFTYFTSFYYSFVDMYNPCENSQFFSLFPLPLIIGIVLIFKKNDIEKDKKLLFNGLIIISLLLLVWNFISLPEIVTKLTLLSMSTPQRSQVTVGYVTVLILIMIINYYDDKVKVNSIISAIVALALISFAAFINIGLFEEYLSLEYVAVMSIILSFVVYFSLVNLKQNKFIVLALLTILTFISGITVNPISKGIDVMYDKPLAKFIQKTVESDSNAKWMVISEYFLTPNYFIANGAPTINSVNVYPNIKLLKQFDTNNDDEFIYNRYAHIMVDISKDVSDYDITSGYYDLIHLNINVNDLPKTGVKYIAIDKDFDEKLLSIYKIEKIYDEYGMKIYKIDYSKNKNA